MILFVHCGQSLQYTSSVQQPLRRRRQDSHAQFVAMRNKGEQIQQQSSTGRLLIRPGWWQAVFLNMVAAALVGLGRNRIPEAYDPGVSGLAVLLEDSSSGRQTGLTVSTRPSNQLRQVADSSSPVSMPMAPGLGADEFLIRVSLPRLLEPGLGAQPMPIELVGTANSMVAVGSGSVADQSLGADSTTGEVEATIADQSPGAGTIGEVEAMEPMVGDQGMGAAADRAAQVSAAAVSFTMKTKTPHRVVAGCVVFGLYGKVAPKTIEHYQEGPPIIEHGLRTHLEISVNGEQLL